MSKEKICCGECEIDPPPCISITGMSTDGWIINGVTCCATINFTYDEVQPLIKYDGGDTMSYDKTESYTRELFYFPVTCPTITQVFWEEGFAGFWVVNPPNEPAYTDCCNDPVIVNLLTTTIRSRGGQRFVLCLRPVSISISFSKVLYTCGEDPPTYKYILRATKMYEGIYEYKNYNKTTTEYTLTDSSDCWNIPTNTSIGEYPFNIETYEPSISPNTSWYYCREKILDTLPTEPLSLTFLESDCPDLDCTYTECVMCLCDLDCFSSGPTGDATPEFGFCDANILVVNTESLGFPVVINHPQIRFLTGHDCLQHKFYYWSAGAPSPGACDPSIGDPTIGTLGPLNTTGAFICCGPTTQLTPSSPDWLDQTNPTHYANISGCTYVHQYDSYTTINSGAGSIVSPGTKPCPTFKIGASIDCYPGWSCSTCPIESHTASAEDPWEMNTPISVGIQTAKYPLYCRTSDATRTVSCSGYIEREICPDYENITITVSPNPCSPCINSPCGWVWLAGESRWIQDTFNCGVADPDGPCECIDSPPEPGEYDGQMILYRTCQEKITSTSSLFLRDLGDIQTTFMGDFL